MSEDPRDSMIRDAAKSYNPPPETPREAIWVGVQAKRAHTTVSAPAKVVRFPRWAWVPVAAAALLAVGIGLGRISVERTETDQPVAEVVETPAGQVEPVTTPEEIAPVETATATPDETPEDILSLPAIPDHLPPLRSRKTVPYQLAATEYLSRTETFLTRVKSDPVAGDSETAGWARTLLSETRLLLDSPAASDPGLHTLLQDLELVLASIVQVSSGTPNAARLETVDAGLARDLLARMRTRIPAGASAGS